MREIERVTRAIEFRRPDRAPFFSIIPAISDMFFMTYTPSQDWQPDTGYYPRLHYLLYMFGNWRPKKPLPLNWASSGKPLQDEFGCVWQAGSADSIGECIGHPIKDWSQTDTFRIPDPRRRERFKTFRNLKKVFATGKFIIGDLANGIFERTHFLRGFEQLMVDLVSEPDKVMRLIDRMIDEWYLGLMEMYARYRCHAVIMTDDWGSQETLMVSPDTWRGIFKPRYKRLIDAAHDKGMKFILHSCGDIRLIIPDLIEIGLDVLQKDDMECLGLDYLEENVSGKLCLFGPLDLQRVLPKAAPEDIKREVRRTISALGRHGGGIMGMIYAQPQAIDIPWHKFALMHYYFYKYGKYPA
ncbi:MAG: uroporphyrinogen decarboxylase family protein [bacterium]